jgi:anti-anti-sigma factor
MTRKEDSMFIRKDAVNVHQAPGKISSTSHIEFLRRLEKSAENGPPRFVLDCCSFERMGTSEIRFLLGCLEEVMKHNGDLRLAMLRPELQNALRLARIDRLFEMYETTEGAIYSYQLNRVSMAIADRDQATEYAA